MNMTVSFAVCCNQFTVINMYSNVLSSAELIYYYLNYKMLKSGGWGHILKLDVLFYILFLPQILTVKFKVAEWYRLNTSVIASSSLVRGSISNVRARCFWSHFKHSITCLTDRSIWLQTVAGTWCVCYEQLLGARLRIDWFYNRPSDKRNTPAAKG